MRDLHCMENLTWGCEKLRSVSFVSISINVIKIILCSYMSHELFPYDNPDLRLTSSHLILHSTIGAFHWKWDREMGSHCTGNDTFPFSLIFDTCTERSISISHGAKVENPIGVKRKKNPRVKFNYHLQAYQINVQHETATAYQVRIINFSPNERKSQTQLRWNQKIERKLFFD